MVKDCRMQDEILTAYKISVLKFEREGLQVRWKDKLQVDFT